MACAFDRRNPRFRVSRAGMTGVALALLVVAPPLAVGTTSGLNVPGLLGVPPGSGTTGRLNTTILSVSATINANCTISTNALSFGQYEALRANATAPLNAAGSVSIACTKGSAPRITLDLGQNPSGPRRQMALAAAGSPGTDRLYYEIYQPPNTAPGTGCSFPGSVAWGPAPAQAFVPSPPANRAARSYSVCGTIPPGQGVSMGSYADTVVATVNF
jgi:spore coat protein U-like protein